MYLHIIVPIYNPCTILFFLEFYAKLQINCFNTYVGLERNGGTALIAFVYICFIICVCRHFHD